MLPIDRRRFHLFTLGLLLTPVGFSQSADISGWSGVRWGATKPAALKALHSLGARECKPTADLCVEAPGEGLIIDKYSLIGIPFQVDLFFLPKFGLSKAIMTADDKRDSFAKVLAHLNAQYGKPGLQSEYDGVDELLRTTWTWVKMRGKVSLEADETSGVFTITYEVRR